MLGDDDNRSFLFWNEILMPMARPYDPIGEIILDYVLNPVKVERLRRYIEVEWNKLSSGTNVYIS